MKRIQRKRTKGWKMLSNSIYVGRPSLWGNDTVIGEMNWNTGKHYTAEEAVENYKRDLKNLPFLIGQRRFEYIYLLPLKGKDLVCWCPLDQPCHADILLEIANK